jgi:translation initiation factor IF-3
VETEKAVSMAYEANLDLVEIAPNANPPVCKIMDYGKYKYKLEISEKENRKKQSQMVVKEIKLRPKIDKNDLNTKKRHIEKFLKNGNKVKITIMFRGREIVHKEIGENLLNSIVEELKEVCTVEQRAKLEGRNMIVVLGPL